MQEYTFKVDECDSHIRLDVFLTSKLEEAPSRTFVKQLIDEKKVSVNGKDVKAHHKLAMGDNIEVKFENVKKDSKLKPENIPLDIFYEDDFLIVINKEKGMLVHPANDTNTSGTLANALLYYCKTLSSVNTDIRPGIVHRLDRETSGLIVAAKDNKTHTRLAKQFEKHRVKKQYVALVEGKIEFDEGVVDASIDRHWKHHDLKRVAFNEGARQAKTFYRAVKRFKNSTLVKLYPHTGRTHQLRVHMTHLGHPILGDSKYGKKNSFSRLALHAQSIGFAPPVCKVFEGELPFHSIFQLPLLLS